MARPSKHETTETPTIASDGGDLPSFWARAMFDYDVVDDSSIQFSRGDIIEVLSTLENGWWDGLVGLERGWFPSNFVTVISEAEAEEELALRSAQKQPPGSVEINPALLSPCGSEYGSPVDEPDHVAGSSVATSNGADKSQFTGEHSGRIMYAGRLGHQSSDFPVVDDLAVPEYTSQFIATRPGGQHSPPPDRVSALSNPTTDRLGESRSGVVFTSSTTASRFWPIVDQANDTISATTAPGPVSPPSSFDNGGSSGPIGARKTTLVKISRTMSSAEMFRHLVLRGCPDVTADLLESSFSERPLAIGGLGDVYRCQLTNGMRVAIKCMRVYGSLDDKDLYKIYLTNAVREVNTWSKLDHPHVLRLLGLADYNGQIGMVSPWIDHGSLRYYLKKTPQANRPRLCTQVADGLSYLHKSGVIHGDLKGDNVLISNSGEPLITDFGNAALLERTLQFTSTTTKGQLSPRWTAPEILEGDACSFESDVYALGMTIL
ncbi:hypothetical protein FRC09_014451, partial [Ceratobasidium sp. 395]